MRKRMMLCLVFAAGLNVGALADGWKNENPSRVMSQPVQELWRAPFAKGVEAFRVEWRDGAKGRVDVVDGALRVEKTNAQGMVMVAVDGIRVPPDTVVQGYAACYLKGAVDPERSKSYIRMWSGRENLKWLRNCFGPTATESPLFNSSINTPPGGFTRKLCRTVAGKDGTVTAAIVVEGDPSVTVWRGWGVEDAKAADKDWLKRTSADDP